jgi:hypothetical protein
VTTTLAALTTTVRRNLRDSTAGVQTFSDAEVGDMIGRGIESLTSFYPQALVVQVTISASAYTYAIPTGLTEIFRVDVIAADGSILNDGFSPSPGQGTEGGWDKHGSTLFIPRSWIWTAGTTLRLWGYGPWTYIDSSSASTAVTNLDQPALDAVYEYVTWAAFERLCSDRSKFQQWQINPDNTNVQPITLYSLKEGAWRRWEKEKSRLRMVRRSN